MRFNNRNKWELWQFTKISTLSEDSQADKRFCCHQINMLLLSSNVDQIQAMLELFTSNYQIPSFQSDTITIPIQNTKEINLRNLI